jgi:hypothetical protein
LRKQIDRGNAGTVTEFDDGRLFALKLDLGAFDAPGWRVGERLRAATSTCCTTIVQASDWHWRSIAWACVRFTCIAMTTSSSSPAPCD